jgi:hypothetical protein
VLTAINFSSQLLQEDSCMLISRVDLMVKLSRLRLIFLGDLKQWRQCVSWEIKYLIMLKGQSENYLRYTVVLNV